MKHAIVLLFAAFFYLGVSGQTVIASISDSDYVFRKDTIRISGDSVFVTITAIKSSVPDYQTGAIFLSSSCILHGSYISWHTNGQKRSEGTYIFGFKANDWIYWDELGHKIDKP